MKYIKIDIKDLEKAQIKFALSGTVIDELAYAAGQWTRDDLYTYSEGEPATPYNFNYDADLLANTKTQKDLAAVAHYCNFQYEPFKEGKMQAGAWLALNRPEQYAILLEIYKNKLEDDRTDAYSERYVEALEKDVEIYYDQIEREWLNGDYRDFRGVVYEIGKHFTSEARECYYDAKEDTYHFAVNEEEATDELVAFNGQPFTLANYKHYLLTSIRDAAYSRQKKDEQESIKRRTEREATLKYQEEQARIRKEERINHLKSLKK